MANTFVSLRYHVVFSTKGREPWLSEAVTGRLWPYLAGIARDNSMKALEIGGVADHIHLLLGIAPSVALSKAVGPLKGNSSAWIKTEFPRLAAFAWQDGYGAFTVGESQIETTRAYIRRQPEHHQTRSFAEEYRAFLQRHRIEFDERYLLG